MCWISRERMTTRRGRQRAVLLWGVQGDRKRCRFPTDDNQREVGVALHKKRKSHPRQWVDCSSPSYSLLCFDFIVTEVNSVDLKHPYTGVQGIPSW